MREAAWWLFAAAAGAAWLAWQSGLRQPGDEADADFDDEPEPTASALAVTWHIWQQRISRDLALAGWDRWGVTPWHLLAACGLGSGAGYMLGTVALRNQVLALFLLVIGGLLPWQVLAWRALHFRRRVLQATGESLLLVAQFCSTARTPYLGIWEALPALAEPIRSELAQSLAEHRNNNRPLGEALQGAARRLGHDYYWHQFGVLTGLAVDNGSPLPPALHKLVRNFELVQAMQSRQRRRQAGYIAFARFAYLASLAPPLYAWLFRPEWWALYVGEPVPRLLLGWIVLSGFAVTQIPAWLGLDIT